MMVGITPRQNALRCRRMVANPCPVVRKTEFDSIHRDCVKHAVDMIRRPRVSARGDSRQLKRLVLDQENVRRTWQELYKASDQMFLPWYKWQWNIRIEMFQFMHIFLFESKLPG